MSNMITCPVCGWSYDTGQSTILAECPRCHPSLLARTTEQVSALVVERDEWKARAEKAEAALVETRTLASAKIEELRTALADARHDLALNAHMLAEQTDQARVAETALAAALDYARPIVAEECARIVESLMGKSLPVSGVMSETEIVVREAAAAIREHGRKP